MYQAFAPTAITTNIASCFLFYFRSHGLLPRGATCQVIECKELQSGNFLARLSTKILSQAMTQCLDCSGALQTLIEPTPFLAELPESLQPRKEALVGGSAPSDHEGSHGYPCPSLHPSFSSIKLRHCSCTSVAQDCPRVFDLLLASADAFSVLVRLAIASQREAYRSRRLRASSVA